MECDTAFTCIGLTKTSQAACTQISPTPIHFLTCVLTLHGNSDQILFRCGGECVGDPALVRDSQIKVRKHAFVAGSTSLA